MSSPRPGRVGAGVYLALTGLACAGLVAAGSLASAQVPPGSPGVPSQGQGHLAGPAALGPDPQQAQAEVVRRPSVLQCHAWPDGVMTQTRDPRSPECVAGWDQAGGNGGSTARGVDENVIRIGVPALSPELITLQEYLNSRYEFYGRSIKLEPIGVVGTEAAQRAAVATAAASGVFAAISTDVLNMGMVSDPAAYLDGLAAVGVIGTVVTGATDRAVSGNGPYSWSIAPTVEDEQRYLGRLACQTLKDRPARFSPDLASAQRSFAVLTAGQSRPAAGFRVVDPAPLQEVLRGCGIEAPTYEYSNVAAEPAASAVDQAVYQRMRDDGVTTLLVVGSTVAFLDRTLPEVEAAGFRPEVVVARRYDGFVSTTQDYRDSVIGISTGRSAGSARTTPGEQALLDSGWGSAQMERGLSADDAFSQLSLIAAGIQAAGPDLTPESFAAGLESTTFPNPLDTPAWGTGAVGLQLGDHVLERDVALGWFDPDHYPTGSPPGFEGIVETGRTCLVDDGARFDLTSELPPDDRGFHDPTQDCDGPGTAPQGPGAERDPAPTQGDER